AAQPANEGKPNNYQSIVNHSVAMVDKTISAPVRWVRNGVDSVHNHFSTYPENERLKEKIDSYDDVAQHNKNYETENESFKKLLDLTQTVTSYENVTG
ncbi:rod shape-determining protein MreC, partial [Enterococcus faecium]